MQVLPYNSLHLGASLLKKKRSYFKVFYDHSVQIIQRDLSPTSSSIFPAKMLSNSSIQLILNKLEDNRSKHIVVIRNNLHHRSSGAQHEEVFTPSPFGDYSFKKKSLVYFTD